MCDDVILFFSSGGITKNSLYQNVGYRPPPPVPPGADEDQPPALPPRNYRRFSASQSDSSLAHRPIHVAKERPSLGYDGHSSESRGRWDDDNYAEQLRKQSRRLSEQQHMPQPMTYKTTKTSIQFTQSYKQQHVEALEATSPNGSTSSSEHFFSSRRLSPGQQPASPNSAPSVPPLPASKYMPSPSSPQISPKAEGMSRSQHYPEPKSYLTPEPKERPRVDIPPPTQSWHNRPSPSSPDPPPPPTPQKEVNVDVDLPPPPPELIESSPDHKEDRNRWAIFYPHFDRCKKQLQQSQSTLSICSCIFQDECWFSCILYIENAKQRDSFAVFHIRDDVLMKDWPQ